MTRTIKIAKNEIELNDICIFELIEYYSKFLDTTLSLGKNEENMISYSDLRGQYDDENGPMYDLVNLKLKECNYYSVNEVFKSKLGNLQSIERSFKVNKDQINEVILYISSSPSKDIKARKLSLEDYETHKRYILKLNPNINENNSCFEYTFECIEKGLYFAIFENSEIVSCTYSPGLLFNEERIVEMGIDTLESHRKNGYAYDCSIAMINDLLSSGRIPMIVIKRSNYKSINLAKKVGFKIFGEIDKIRTYE